MDLLSLLKELKKIEPDRAFALKSKNMILAEKEKKSMGVWEILRSNIEFGASIALMVAIVYVMLGGLSNSKVGAPLQISNLDPAGLKAEAQAISLQIQLANLSYQEGSSAPLKVSESTPSRATVGVLGGTKAPSEIKDNSTSSEAASIDSVSVDEELDKLSK